MDTRNADLNDLFRQFEGKSTDQRETRAWSSSANGITISAGSIGKVVVINNNAPRKRRSKKKAAATADSAPEDGALKHVSLVSGTGCLMCREGLAPSGLQT